MIIDGYNKYTSFMGPEGKPGPARTERDTHFENFIAGVRSRKREELNAEIEEGAMSCVLVHLANIRIAWAGRSTGTRRRGPSKATPRRIRCSPASTARLTSFQPRSRHQLRRDCRFQRDRTLVA